MSDSNNEAYKKFLKVTIPSYFFWMNVLRENLITLNKIIPQDKESRKEKEAHNKFISRMQSIGAWTNFQKHPEHILKIHHPKIMINGSDDEVNLNGFTFDCTTVNEYFNGSSEAGKNKKLSLINLVNG